MFNSTPVEPDKAKLINPDSLENATLYPTCIVVPQSLYYPFKFYIYGVHVQSNSRLNGSIVMTPPGRVGIWYKVLRQDKFELQIKPSIEL